MPPLDHAKAQEQADKQLIASEADKIIAMQAAGCKILHEIQGMSDKDVLDVFAAARKKITADASHPPSVSYDARTYAQVDRGYGYMPDIRVPKVHAVVESFVPGKGFSPIVTYDSGTTNWGDKQQSFCEDRK